MRATLAVGHENETKSFILSNWRLLRTMFAASIHHPRINNIQQRHSDDVEMVFTKLNSFVFLENKIITDICATFNITTSPNNQISK